MASEIRVDKITHTAGVGTITPSPTGVHIAGIVTGTTFSGSGASLTNLPAANLTGTVADARFPATLPAASGANLTSLPAGNLTGTVADARLSTVSSSKLSGALPALDGSALTGIGGTDFIHAEQISVSGVTTATAFIPTQGQLSNRNIIINGAMQVAQRGTSFAAPADGYTLDRWSVYENLSTGQVEVTQENVTDLIGFTKAAKINCTTAEAGVPSASGQQYATYIQQIEAQNLTHIGNGTSSAKTLTFSFYVKSNVTGTFCVSFYKPDNTTRLLSLPYTINSANTWEQKTLSLPADTSGGGINDDNGQGLGVYFILARKTSYSGTTSTSWINYTDTGWANTCTASIFENVNDHMFITGCQLEVGSVATPFEHKKFAEELALCQRYFCKVAEKGGAAHSVGVGCNYSSSNAFIRITFPQTMRTTPTLDQLTGSNYYVLFQQNAYQFFNSFESIDSNTATPEGAEIYGTSFSLTQGSACFVRYYNTSAEIRFNAEL